jgi:hypothetical protein
MTRRTNATIAGVTFLLYIAIGITQMVLGGATNAESISERLALIAQHVVQVRINLLLGVLVCFIAVTLAVTLYAITRDEDRDLAVLALCFRVTEGMLAVIGIMTTVGLLWLATDGAGTGDLDRGAAHAIATFLQRVRGWNVTIAATLFAAGSTIFCWLMLRGRMIPVALAWLGVFASILLLMALPLQLAGFLSGSIVQFLWLPMALFEIPLGVWLIVKGAAPPAPRPA